MRLAMPTLSHQLRLINTNKILRISNINNKEFRMAARRFSAKCSDTRTRSD